MTGRKSPSIAPSQPSDAPSGPALIGLDSAVFSGVNVQLDARLGSVDMTIETLLALRGGSVVTLDAQLNDLVELHLNGTLVGRGQIVAVDDRFGIRIVDIATRQ